MENRLSLKQKKKIGNKRSRDEMQSNVIESDNDINKELDKAIDEANQKKPMKPFSMSANQANVAPPVV